MSVLLLSQESGGFIDQLVEAFTPDMFMSWEFWTVLSALLLVAEILTSGFLLGAFVPGTGLAAVLAALGVGMQGQLWGFIAGTLIGLVVLRPMILARAQRAGEPTNVEALVGQAALVTEALGPSIIGRVKVRTEEWRATADSQIDAGVSVSIVRVEGNVVHVMAPDQ